MSNVNLNFNNSNAITGFDKPEQISPNNTFAIGGEPDSSGKAGWGHDTLQGLGGHAKGAQEQILSASKELATAYEDVMARIGESTADGAPSHVLDNLKRVASDILGGAKELMKSVGTMGSDAALESISTIMEAVQANMGELSKISKDPGIYYPDLSETAAPESKEEVSADTKRSPDVASPRLFNEELRTTQAVTNPNMTTGDSAAVKAFQGAGKSETVTHTSNENDAGKAGSITNDASPEISGGNGSERSTQEWRALMKSDPIKFGEELGKLSDQAADGIMRNIQEFTQKHNRISSMLSNLMMAEHQTQKAIIQNFRV